MSDRLWDRSDEWSSYAACIEKPDFIIAPEALGPQRVAEVKKICAGCAVRPECIEAMTAPVIAPSSLKKGGGSDPVLYPSCSMWVAGEWLGDRDTAASRAALEKTKEELHDSLPYEYANRPMGMI